MNIKRILRTFSIVQYILGIILFLISCTLLAGQEEENLNTLDQWIEWSDAKNMLVHHLNDQAFKLLDDRDKMIAGLNTKEDWSERQEEVKNILMNIVGPFPEKTPLNPKITGIVKKDGFRIEKIIFESMPGFYVTGALFIPNGSVRNTPAIVQVSGHYPEAFRAKSIQKQLYNLVKKGFIVFAIDPIGQGERIQYWDNAKKESKMGSDPTREHFYLGNQMFLSGISPIRYFTWDGIRAVDYLLTRDEVDPGRIGIFGCSGGGTQATFIAAMDERIRAAAPGCYITGFRRLFESIGPQDAEQNIYQGILNRITHADLLEVRAPKPLLISSTTRDFFSIQGAIETYNEAKRAYKAFGKENNIGQAIDDAGHGFNKSITDVYAFFQKVFNLSGSSVELSFEGFTPKDLQITSTGQLSTSIGGKLAFDINKKEAEILVDDLNNSRKNIEQHLKLVPQKAAELSGYIPPADHIKSVFRGRYHRDGYSIEKYVLHGEGEYVIPLLMFIPDIQNITSNVIYLHPKGKFTDASVGGKIEQLVKRGHLVAAPDVIGVGEVGDNNSGFDYRAMMIGNSGFDYRAMMIGRSVVGIQAGDVIRVAKFLRERTDDKQGPITGIAFNELCPTLLHAAAFSPDIKNVALIDPLVSYRSVTANKYYNAGLSKYFVGGALTAYDLPDLAACLAPGRLLMINSTDGEGHPIDITMENEDVGIIKNAYSAKNASNHLQIIRTKFDDQVFEELGKWME
ncbi:MAG: acetylxylan esterase [Candidatus Berkelbacteria bacterium]|nr:acetylxylan esterase [Candidatus Berkelbacteria bacterium]